MGLVPIEVSAAQSARLVHAQAGVGKRQQEGAVAQVAKAFGLVFVQARTSAAGA